MKVQDFIDKLEKARDEYWSKYDPRQETEVPVFVFDLRSRFPQQGANEIGILLALVAFSCSPYFSR